ncbi:MAG: D-alanyl-D-alanine carboxypeptidase family protein [Erysipelotrichaceae bacterium]
MKKILIICIVFIGLIFSSNIYAKEEVNNKDDGLGGNASSIYLLEYNSNTVVYEKNSKDKLYPASMTKMMSLIIIYEKINDKSLKLDDIVSVSAHAASMGGSQVYLAENEKMSVNDLLKATCIASANDAVTALAEKISGSEENFVKSMNEHAKALKLENTNFVNPTGLHNTNHYSCSKDMATIAKELIKVGGPDLLKITSTYDAYIRESTPNKFWLVNTNKLLKSYPSVDGLKTGYTTEAKSCITTTANKDGIRLIAVVMGASDAKSRNTIATNLLNYGFSQFNSTLLYKKDTIIEEQSYSNGKPNKTNLLVMEDTYIISNKTNKPELIDSNIENIYNSLPIKKGEHIANLNLKYNNDYNITIKLKSSLDINPLNYIDTFFKFFKAIII